MFERIRTIKGRRYRYLEKRWREGGKVRSQSWCLGALDWTDQPKLGHGGYLEQMEQYPWPREEAAKENSPDKSGEEAATDMLGAVGTDGSPDSPS